MQQKSISASIIFFFFCCCCCSFCLTTSNGFESQQYAALQELYDSTDGDNWFYPPKPSIHKWDFSDTNPCVPFAWDGLTCNDQDTGKTPNALPLMLTPNL